MPYPHLASTIDALLAQLTDNADFDAAREAEPHLTPAHEGAVNALRFYRGALLAPRDYRREVPDGEFMQTSTFQIRGEIGPPILLEFTWHGGAYISVGRRGRGSREVINVWDAATDQPLIPRTVEAMTARIDEWIKEYGEGEGEQALAHDVLHNWYV